MNSFVLAKYLVVYPSRLIYEFFYVWISRILHILQGGVIISDTKKYKDFIIDKKNLNLKGRKDGISGFYRVKNEEYLLEVSVESHIKYLDEIVIVYNDCLDKTAEIADKLKKKYPNKVKVYEYIPEVYTVLSRKHMLELGSSPHSIVNFYNFTLSKTTKKIVVKIDADHVAIKGKFDKIVDKIRDGKMVKDYFYFQGVNIFECPQGVCINKKNPFTFGFDCGFFEMTNNTYFVHRRKYETLHLPLIKYIRSKNVGVLFYHLKGFKKDSGTAFLDDTVKDDKREVARIRDMQLNPDLIKWDEFDHANLRDIDYPNIAL